MASVIEICNLALGNLGKEDISSLSEASNGARACKKWYDICVGSTLEAYPWRFARATQAMGQVVNTMTDKWRYAYALPNEAIRLWDVVPDQTDTWDSSAYVDFEDLAKETPKPRAFDIENGVVFCNLSPAYAKFIRKVTDPTKYTPLFIDALSWALSARIAIAMTGDPKMLSTAVQMAQQAIRLAASTHANHVPTSYVRVSSYAERD